MASFIFPSFIIIFDIFKFFGRREDIEILVVKLSGK